MSRNGAMGDCSGLLLHGNSFSTNTPAIYAEEGGVFNQSKRFFHQLMSKDMLCSRLMAAVGIAQVLSLLLAVMGFTSGELVAHNFNIPTFQSFLNYVLLACSCGMLHVAAHGFTITNNWYYYLLLAFMDVEANFLVTKAYQYTSVTSVTLLDCLTIPAVMLLSALVLKSQYKLGHGCGAALCILGVATLILTDSSSDTGGPNPQLGDLLVCLGACVYAISNVCQERLLIDTPVTEVLAMLGVFGTVIAGIQAACLEATALATASWSPAAVVYLLCFSCALYLFYVLVPRVISWSSATVLNLSLLTSDVYVGVARLSFFGGFGGTGMFFALAVLLEAVGLVVYAASGETHHPACDKDVDSVSRLCSQSYVNPHMEYEDCDGVRESQAQGSQSSKTGDRE